MKKTNIAALIEVYAIPVVLMVLGVILLVNPDSASIVVARVLSWILNAAGIGYGIYAVLGSAKGRTARIATAVFCLILGCVLLVNPLILARNIGRVLGILLAVEGFQILHKDSGSHVLGMLTLVGAVVLLTAPLAASRLVFSLCGLILLGIGTAQLLDRKRRAKLREKNEKPDIIDAL